MKSIALAATALLATAFAATPAQADEIVGGLYVHDVDTILTIAGVEKGADVQIGWRGERIGKTPLQPYAFVAINTAGETNYGAIGLSAKFGNRFFIRPGIGTRINDRMTIEASWVHMSHATLFGDQNPGIDNIGARLSFKL